MSDVTLDPERQARAAARARAALAAAERWEIEAARERAKAASICATWNLDPTTLAPLRPGQDLSEPPVCGGDYDKCSGCPNHPS